MAPGLVLVYRPERKSSPSVLLATGIVGHVTADEFLKVIQTWDGTSDNNDFPDPMDLVNHLYVVEVDKLEDFLRVMQAVAANLYPVVAIVDSVDESLHQRIAADSKVKEWLHRCRRMKK